MVRAGIFSDNYIMKYLEWIVWTGGIVTFKKKYCNNDKNQLCGFKILRPFEV